MRFTHEQKKAYDTIMNTDHNVFLTGGAGSGKSEIIKRVIDNSDHPIVLAPTGIAAINVNGITIHHFLKIKPSQMLINTTPHYIPKELEYATKIIVDEISMCRSDLFNWLAIAIHRAEVLYNKKIQLIVVGDFCQLPPVVKKNERVLFKAGEEYAFMSEYWKEMDFDIQVLHQIMRQKTDTEFITALNNIRCGKTKGIEYINQNANKIPSDDCVYLASLNRQVDKINHDEALKLKSSEQYTFTAQVSGRINAKNMPVDEVLTLAVGERIIVTANDTENRQYQNGTTGTIIDIDDYHREISIEGDNGNDFIIRPHEWEVYDYELKQVASYETIKKDGKEVRKRVMKTKPDKIKIGGFVQFPIKLGYAITVHKSQGQTYDRVNLSPAGWTSGLLYVSLSRVKTVNGLYLKSPIKKHMVNLDPIVRDFYAKFDDDFRVKMINAWD